MYFHYVISDAPSITYLRFWLASCIVYDHLQEAYFALHQGHYHVVVKYHPASHFRIHFDEWLIADCGELNCSKDEWFGYLSDNGRHFIHTVSVSAPQDDQKRERDAARHIVSAFRTARSGNAK